MEILFRRSALPFLVAAFVSAPLSATESRSVVNLDTTTPSVDIQQLGSGPEQLVRIGARALFLASTPEHGREPWVSDGTPEGTRLLVDTCPGPASGVPGNLEVHEGLSTVFFVLPPCPPSLRRVIWRTDGTTAGTRALFPFDSVDDRAWSVAETAGDNLLVRHEGRLGLETLLGLDGAGGAVEELQALQPFAGVLANLGEHTVYRRISPPSLVSTDGTLSGTQTIGLLEGGVEFGSAGRFGGDAVVLAHFAIDSTVRLLRIGTSPGAFETLLRQPVAAGFRVADSALVAGASRIFFQPSPGDLWVSDGTAAGTRRVIDLGAGAGVFLPTGGELPGGKWLFFRSSTSGLGIAPWVTDGTAGGTFGLGDRQADGLPVRAGSRVIFRAFDPVNGTEPWGSDGTLAGTVPLGDFCPGLCSSSAEIVADPNGGDAWLIRAETFNPAPGDFRRILRSDGTPGGTRSVAAFADGQVVNLLPFGADAALFGRRTDDFVPEVWITGIPAGDAELLATFGASRRERGGEPRDLRVQGGRLLFAAHGESGGDQVFTSDGTEAGTRPLSVITGPAGRILASVVVSQKLVAAVDQGGGGEMMTVDLGDGTTELLTGPSPLGLDATSPLARLGTEAVAGLPAGGLAVTRLSTGSVEIMGQGEIGRIVGDPAFVALGGRLYFVAEAEGESRLWETDGTAAGTRQVLAGERWILRVVGLEDRLIVTELAPISKERVLALVPRPGGQRPLEIPLGTVGRTVLATTLPGKALIFYEDSQRLLLVATDGTSAGTTAVGPQTFTTWRSLAPKPVALGGTLYFVLEDVESGVELWRTDGTRLGTRLVSDLVPGVGSSHPSALRAAGDRLFFAASDVVHGNELWTSDGTASGTHRLTDLAPGADSASPAEPTALGPELYFAATDGVIGRELWALPLAALPSALPPSPSSRWLNSTAVPGFRFQVRFSGGQVGRLEPACLAETLCVSGAVSGRPEVFLRVVGPKPNGFLWPTVVKFSTATVEVWIEQPTTGEIRYYSLAGARPGFDELPGLFDRQGFRPHPAALAIARESDPERSDPPPPVDGWFTTPAVPGFRIAVRIQGAANVRQEPCLAETLCVSGALPGRPEVFARVVGPKPNGRLWPTLVKFTTSEVEVWVEQLRTRETKYYRLRNAEPGSGVLTGLFDRVGFRP